MNFVKPSFNWIMLVLEVLLYEKKKNKNNPFAMYATYHLIVFCRLGLIDFRGCLMGIFYAACAHISL